MKTPVHTFFDNYAAALMSFSAEKIAEFYQTPLAVYSDQGVLLVKEMSEVVAFWKEGVKPYQSSNIVKAVPSVLTEEKLSEKVLISKVLWKNYDAEETRVANEINLYILSVEKDKVKIIGLILMTQAVEKDPKIQGSAYVE